MENGGMTADNKRKHLEMIQGIINRLASNQFLFKGWSVTLIAAIAAFTAKGNNPALMAIPIVAALLFWAVDAYYLMLERAYRNLYDATTSKNENKIDFKMKTAKEDTSVLVWLRTLWRPILVLFYGVVLVALVLLMLVINNVQVEVILRHGS